MSTPSNTNLEAQLIAALREESLHPRERDRERRRVYARLGATLAIGSGWGALTSSVAHAATEAAASVGTSAGAAAAAGTAAAGTAAAGTAAAGTAAAGTAAEVGLIAAGASSAVAISALHPALTLVAGAVLGIGVMSGVSAVQAPVRSVRAVPSVQDPSAARRSLTARPTRIQLEPKPVAPVAAASSSVTPPPDATPASSVGGVPLPLRAVLPTKAPRPDRSAANASAANASASLAEQQVLLDAARRALARSNGAAALEALTWHRARFPETALAEEREALTVKALRASGRDAEAQQRAGEFLRRYPASVFTEGMSQPSNP